jgi:hypothetical protein
MQPPHFRIYPVESQWQWEVLSADGAVRASGSAISKRHAAACVIHKVIRGATAGLAIDHPRRLAA